MGALARHEFPAIRRREREELARHRVTGRAVDRARVALLAASHAVDDTYQRAVPRGAAVRADRRDRRRAPHWRGAAQRAARLRST
jgi:hypothetical protein